MSEVKDLKVSHLEVKSGFTRPINPVHKTCNIILNIMIKNEEKIIERCLNHCIDYVDAVCILDTGSTDSTLDRCVNFLDIFRKPAKILIEPFKNFGHNRTISFENSQRFCSELNWDPDRTYAMTVDADMNIMPSPKFMSFDMRSNGYRVIQEAGNLKYFNTRFMKCSHPWKCIGSTHEYWSGDQISNIPEEIFYIEDKNDGGCKSDKFVRDVRFLREELLENPNNSRAHFYLGRSLQALGESEIAVFHFKEVIRLNGWVEEIWSSHYEIGKCYKNIGDENKMEFWMNKTFEFRPTRAEPIYYLCKYFRENSQHYKSYHYYLKGKDIPYPREDILFIESDVYNGLFSYENTIISYYVNGKSRRDGLTDFVEYINKPIPFNLENVWNNMHWSIETLTSDVYRAKYTKLNFPDHKEYSASSCALFPYENGTFLLNIRYVNYIISPTGSYTIKSSDDKIKTHNKMITLDENYRPESDLCSMEEKLPQRYVTKIEGLEDVRLFNFNGRMFFSASVNNLNPHGKIEIAVGVYDVKNSFLHEVTVIEPPSPTTCEKNWIFVRDVHLANEEAKNKMNFIYKWHPLQIGCVNNNQLNIHTSFDTPKFFDRFRGSSNICEYDGKLWTVVHFVKYSTPRVYYHSVVQLNSSNMRPEKYSLPFCFRNKAIEYCLGFNIRADGMCFVVSENDSNPCIIKLDKDILRFVKS